MWEANKGRHAVDREILICHAFFNPSMNNGITNVSCVYVIEVQLSNCRFSMYPSWDLILISAMLHEDISFHSSQFNFLFPQPESFPFFKLSFMYLCLFEISSLFLPLCAHAIRRCSNCSRPSYGGTPCMPWLLRLQIYNFTLYFEQFSIASHNKCVWFPCGANSFTYILMVT